MSLQFPNARLLIHNLLAIEHLSGAEAIARGAREYGLTTCETPESEEAEIKKAIENCDCCEAAHCVLRTYFHHKDGGSEDSIEAAWKSMMRRLSKYTAGECQVRGKESGPNCQSACSRLAPVVFDLLLQEVRRYT